jgi:hypothetical protein
MTITVKVNFTKEEKEIIHQASDIIAELGDKLDEHGVSEFEELDYDGLKFISNSLSNIESRIIKDWREKYNG